MEKEEQLSIKYEAKLEEERLEDALRELVRTSAEQKRRPRRRRTPKRSMHIASPCAKDGRSGERIDAGRVYLATVD